MKEVQDPAESEAAGTLHTEQSPIGKQLYGKKQLKLKHM